MAGPAGCSRNLVNATMAGTEGSSGEGPRRLRMHRGGDQDFERRHRATMRPASTDLRALVPDAQRVRSAPKSKATAASWLSCDTCGSGQ
jgi:hypothetical protein